MKTILITLLLMPVLAVAQITTYRGQAGKILVWDSQGNNLTEFANIGLAMTNANVIGSEGRQAIIYIGAGHAFTNNVALNFSPNVSMVGAGTNKTTIWTTNGLAGPGIPFQPGDNSTWQDFRVVNTFTNDSTVIFGRIASTESCTNVLLLRVQLEGDSGCLHTGDASGAAGSQVWTISNCVFSARLQPIFVDSLSASAPVQRYYFYNCDIQGVGRVLFPTAWNGVGDVPTIKLTGTNTLAVFKNCRIRAQGGTNMVSGSYVNAAHIMLDNTQVALGTNGILATPANKRFSVYLTNNALAWFKNVEGPATNTVTTSSGRFFYEQTLDFPAFEPWPWPE